MWTFSHQRGCHSPLCNGTGWREPCKTISEWAGKGERQWTQRWAGKGERQWTQRWAGKGERQWTQRWAAKGERQWTQRWAAKGERQWTQRWAAKGERQWTQRWAGKGERQWTQRWAAKGERQWTQRATEARKAKEEMCREGDPGVYPEIQWQEMNLFHKTQIHQGHFCVWYIRRPSLMIEGPFNMHTKIWD